MIDHHLYTTKGPSPNTVLWRPPGGSSVVLKETDFRPFSYIVRTVHLPDALTICAENGIKPKPVVSLSTLNAQVLQWQRDHPCRNLHVLWFGAKLDGEDEDAHDWYGNIEFTIPTDVLLQRWKNLYLVEMITAPTHTSTRILVTNSDYSSVLPQYDPRTPGGPWQLTPDGRHECLVDCRRYNSDGYNLNGHKLEFMIEVTPFGMREILGEATISFRNHQLARSGRSHACHRFGSPPTCPTPFTKNLTSMIFFKEHQHLIAYQPIATPRLSPSAKIFRQRFLEAKKIPRNTLQIPPSLPDHHFPSLPPPGQSVIFDKILQQCFQNGRIRKRQLMFAFEQENVYSIFAESIWDPNKEEEEVIQIHRQRRRHPKILPHSMHLAPPPGFLLHPPSMGFPPLHLPPPSIPPAVFHRTSFTVVGRLCNPPFCVDRNKYTHQKNKIK